MKNFIDVDEKLPIIKDYPIKFPALICYGGGNNTCTNAYRS